VNCCHCDQPIRLVPSATERAARFGGRPADYTRLFTAHADCTIRHRNELTSRLIQSLEETLSRRSTPLRLSEQGDMEDKAAEG
jgi:hypothetical protein